VVCVIRGEIVCGRRFCKACGRWRLIVDFGVNKRWPDGSVRYLFASCKRCELARKRNWRPPKRYLSDSERRQRVRDYWRERRRNDSVFRTRRREYERIYKEGRRRAAGVPERRYVNATRAPDLERDQDLPVEPFARWLEGRVLAYGGVETFARSVGLNDTAPLRRVLRRGDHGRPKKSVRLSFADKIVTLDGSTFLWEIWPELYPDVEVDERRGVAV
jgi:hypothetical protein